MGILYCKPVTRVFMHYARWKIVIQSIAVYERAETTAASCHQETVFPTADALKPSATRILLELPHMCRAGVL
jgi:hypothetical protein